MGAIKAGWKTTEFWVSIATAVCGLLVTLGVFSPDQSSDLIKTVGTFSGAIIVAVTSAAYAISRSKSKSENPVVEK
jgi:uncharacterized protein (DUF697 family)